MSFRSLLAALVFGASDPVRDPRLPRVTTAVIDRYVSPEREAKLIEDGRKEIDNLLARTRVERSNHFDAPRFAP